MKIVRFAYVVDGLNSGKLNKILNRMIVSVLFDSTRNLTAQEIVAEISSTYELDFSSEEIKKAICENKEQYYFDDDKELGRFQLSDKGRKVADQINYHTNLESCVDLFLSENTINFKLKLDLINDINTYFYYIFNSDKELILSLISSKKPPLFDLKEFKNSTLLDMFLNWNNDEKNELLIKVCRASFDYCTLTLKDNSNTNIFKGKRFYVDTNVLFSLIGINGMNVKKVTQKFVEKCNELSILLIFTNLTYREATNTIDSLVDRFKNYFATVNYGNSEMWRTFFPNSSYSALFDLYSRWCKQKSGRSGNYDGFREELHERLFQLTSQFQQETIPSDFEEKNNEKLSTNITLYDEFKITLGRKRTESSIKHDVIHYMYIESKRNTNSVTIKDQNNLFITFDTSMCRWASKNNNGVVPLILPISTVYSLLLRFCARTTDDIKSFGNFIQLSVNQNFYSDEFYSIKKSLIDEVNKLEEPNEVKERILFISNEILTNSTKTYVTNEEIVEAVKQGTNSFFAELDKQHNVELAKKDEEKEIEKSEAYNKGLTEGEDSVYKDFASRIKNRNHIINNFIFYFILCGLSILLLVFGIIDMVKNSTCTFSGLFMFLGTAATVILAFLKPFKILVMKFLNLIFSEELDKILSNIKNKHKRNSKK